MIIGFFVHGFLYKLDFAKLKNNVCLYII